MPPLTLNRGFWTGAAGGGNSDPYWSDVVFALVGSEVPSGGYLTSSGSASTTMYTPNSSLFSHDTSGGPFSEGSYVLATGGASSSAITNNSGSPTFDSTDMTDETTWTVEAWFKHTAALVYGTGVWISADNSSRIIIGPWWIKRELDCLFRGRYARCGYGRSKFNLEAISFR